MKAQKAKSAPEIIGETKYRGFKIREVLNKKTNRREFKTRFQFNNKEFYLTDEKLKTLYELIDETLYRERRRRLGFEVATVSPSVSELFNKYLPKISRRHQRTMAERIFQSFLSLLPDDIKIIDLRRAHFQKYIDFRLSETGKQSGQKIAPSTVKREMSIISAAWRASPAIFPELDNFEPFQIPKAKVKRGRREMSVAAADFEKLIGFLMREKISKETDLQYFHRVRLAHSLQFALETGFRRKEITALKFSQFDAENHALKNVERFKTDTRTPFFPLSKKAEEIIIERRKIQTGEFIFSQNGLPIEANYRTLKKACEFLEIPYGRFTGGFVVHDLRHQFATEIIQVTDIETAKSLTGHSGKEILTYLHTTANRQREAIEKRQKTNFTLELKEIFTSTIKGELTEEKFIEKIKKLFNK